VIVAAIADESGHQCTATPCPVCQRNIASKTIGAGEPKVQTKGKKQGDKK
jgi:hypothetical protein